MVEIACDFVERPDKITVDMKRNKKFNPRIQSLALSQSQKRIKNVDDLVSTVSDAIEHVQIQISSSVNSMMTWLYWGIGRHIVEFERGGERAVYGRELLKEIGRRLVEKHGRGYSWRNLYLMCQFYEGFQEPVLLQSLVAKLSFSKLIQVLSVETPEKKSFYLQMTIKERWPVRTLRRQITSGLYERTPAAMRHKILTPKQLSAAAPERPEEIIKDPYVFEFLGLPDNSYTENELEKALVDRLQNFLTELGKGFCFEARQKRIDLAGQDYYIDLVFYHRILKSAILIDLKIGPFVHSYAGQMNYYLNWWKDNEMYPGDKPPIGLILCASKKDAHAEFALGGIANRIFVSQYQTKLPTKSELQQLLMKTQGRWEQEHGKLPAQEVRRINEDIR